MTGGPHRATRVARTFNPEDALMKKKNPSWSKARKKTYAVFTEPYSQDGIALGGHRAVWVRGGSILPAARARPLIDVHN